MFKHLHPLKTALLSSILFISLMFFGATAVAQTLPTAERIAFTAFRNGQWDIYSIGPDGSGLKQLTRDAAEYTDPAYAPDGSKLAYASRRDHNWDVYVLDLATGQETRLTDSPHYDGAPSWSPDGQFIAYESYQNGDLDVWLVDAAGSEPATNLTAESLAGDYGPAWSPDGQFIAFTSWRQPEAEPGSTPQVTNRNLFLLSLADGRLTRLTDEPTAEIEAAWHPDGDKLVFTRDDLGDVEVFTLDITNPPAAGGQAEPVTWLGRTDGPTWSPAGKTIAAVFHRWDGEMLSLTDPSQPHALPRQLTGIATMQGRLSWHAGAIDFGVSLPSLADTGLAVHLYEERLGEKNGSFAGSFNLVRLDGIEVGTPWLADSVDDSFQAWRLRLRDEVGYDFLSHLSDATRDVAAFTETSQYASWHKSGRAIDTLFDYHLNGQLAHEIVRENYNGETFWRVYLRCADQTGRCGRPVVANPWNYSERARSVIAPGQGGIEKNNLSGYYVDMTAMAREYGWDRISAYDDDEEYSWTWHFLAFEYWHYQKRFETNGRVNWYQAMLNIYPPETLERFFNWNKMQAIGDDPHLIALKGVPLPPEFRPWWALVAP